MNEQEMVDIGNAILNPDTLSKLILCRMTEDEAGEETISAMDDDFEVIEYPDDWLDFTEIMREKQ